MRSARFLTHCLSMPWAMDPRAMEAYAAILVHAYARREGMDLPAPASKSQPPFVAAASRARGSGGAGGAGSIAVIRVYGPLVQRSAQLGPCEDGTSAEDIGAALNAAMADETVGQILMEFDTPGGSVFGIDELATQMREQRSRKPIVGIANSMSASAGYYLMSQCSECYVTPGGLVGSIGVYSAHQDISKAMDAAGVKMNLISAGKYKVEGNPFEPLGADARGSMQSMVNDYYDSFIRAVSKGRGVSVDTVRNGMGQGRVLGAHAALAETMVDGVMTFAALAADLQRRPRHAQQKQGAKAMVLPGVSSAASAVVVRSAQANRNELELLSL